MTEAPAAGERTLLVVHHTPSPPTRELLEAVLAGTHDPDIEGVAVRSVPALGATVPDVLAADGYLFGTSANFPRPASACPLTSSSADDRKFGMINLRLGFKHSNVESTAIQHTLCHDP